VVRGEVLASLDGALAAAREHGADEFLVALRWDSQELLETIRSRLRESPLPVRLLPDHNIRTLLGQRGLSTGRAVAPGYYPGGAALTAFERAAKRTLDVVGSMTAILFLCDRHQVR
jgi:putative colanic acid biosysnthesis UDP-glucose lipid carrier transferase